MRALEGAAYLLSFSWYSRRKCKVGENAILGLSRAEMVRIYVFTLNTVSVTYDEISKLCIVSQTKVQSGPQIVVSGTRFRVTGHVAIALRAAGCRSYSHGVIGPQLNVDFFQ